ncbi:MAG: hypothetical protein HOP29_03995 [Phycisphaerales bacterium]|nr:hypothetical protein [Phycisphaerales bacterium]
MNRQDENDTHGTDAATGAREGLSHAIDSVPDHDEDLASAADGRPDGPHISWSALFPEHVDLAPAGEAVDGRKLPARGGVYAFIGDDERIVQVMAAESVRRTALARLNQPVADGSSKRADLRAVTRRIAWRPTWSRFETSWVYLSIARRLWPTSYRRRLGFGPAYFATVDLDGRLPRWRVEEYAWNPGRREVGPFARRGHCAAFIETLVDLFDLCRDYAILERVPDGRPCSYFDMGRCPAPCDGSVSLDAYRSMMRASYAFAIGRGEERLSEWEGRMQEAAGQRDFARAQRIKETLARARKSLRRDGPVVPTPDTFRYLVVQRGRGRSTVIPYFVRAGAIDQGAAATIDEVPHIGIQWMEAARRTVDETAADRIEQSGHIWLVTHFLAKGESAPGLFLHVDELPTPDNLAAIVRQKFARASAAGESDATNA